MYFNTVIIIIFMYMYSMYIMYAYIFHNDNNVIIKLSNNNNYQCKKLKNYEKKIIFIINIYNERSTLLYKPYL